MRLRGSSLPGALVLFGCLLAADLISACGASAAVTLTTSGAAVACPSQGLRISTVTTAGGLSRELRSARPDDEIVLSPGIYRGDFTDTRAGTATQPIVICGPSSAVLDGGTLDHGYTLYLDGADYTTVEGITVEHGLKGIMADYWDHGTIDDVTVVNIGQEGIHLRRFSSYDVIEHSRVSHTGLSSASNSIHYGIGIYVGSAYENWPRYTGGAPDRCDYDTIIDNSISYTAAKSVDIKEGTTGGKLIGNYFNGTGIVPPEGAEAWVDVKGNDWLISDNSGIHSPRDGFEVHVKYPGWGRDNVFTGNHVDLDHRGFGFNVADSGTDTTVSCTNVVVGPQAQFSNLDLTCPSTRSRVTKSAVAVAPVATAVASPSQLAGAAGERAGPTRHWAGYAALGILVAFVAAVVWNSVGPSRRPRRRT